MIHLLPPVAPEQFWSWPTTVIVVKNMLVSVPTATLTKPGWFLNHFLLHILLTSLFFLFLISQVLSVIGRTTSLQSRMLGFRRHLMRKWNSARWQTISSMNCEPTWRAISSYQQICTDQLVASSGWVFPSSASCRKDCKHGVFENRRVLPPCQSWTQFSEGRYTWFHRVRCQTHCLTTKSTSSFIYFLCSEGIWIGFIKEVN